MKTVIERKSGIEILKVFAMLIIIISHIIVSSGIDISNSSTNITNIVISMLSYCGNFGNIIFFTCTAYFLIDNNEIKIDKIIKILGCLWFMYYFIFAILIIYTLFTGNINWAEGNRLFHIQQFFPFLLCSNWYITCYIIFYLIHGYLNIIIKKLPQKIFFAYCVLFTFIYYILGFLIQQHFTLSNNLILWIVLYFDIAYIKKYMENIFLKKNICAILAGGGLYHL